MVKPLVGGEIEPEVLLEVDGNVDDGIFHGLDDA